MGLITVAGQTGCRFEEVARISAQRLHFQLVTESHLATTIEKEFGPGTPIPDRAYADLMASILAGMSVERHLLVAAEGAESLFKRLPGMVRIFIVAPEAVRVGNVMLDRRLDRPAARQLLRQMEQLRKEQRKRRFGKVNAPPESFDLIVNAEKLSSDQIADIIEAAVVSTGLIERGALSAAAEAQIQFQVRLRLAKHGIVPPGKVSLPRKPFAHPSEQIFANLLDFYRIPWDYEPRSFPIQWDRDGKVSEAFTPDFYLHEFDLYVELTTMKQSLVTRKNRKVKLLRQIYPHINIQVYYQKDFENLIFKYGLAERLTTA